MRTIAMATVVLAITAGEVLVQETLAQNAPMTSQSLKTPPLPPLQSPSTGGATGVPQAPVGHRQPTLRDLPPEIRREEQSTDLHDQTERAGEYAGRGGQQLRTRARSLRALFTGGRTSSIARCCDGDNR